ncbi:putative small secreted protein [Virgibacillus natechei]|uniref:Small secreted protein n=1 Tax=Virgibacillus natechei TaxID=1216297 RepID=A0ABS4IF29_9BACI|nr:PepSY domain-containing protein [Virgibacillus natechei]MBP1968931.1 putative small secreted protein [Virgibacillus natechei]UZD11722.1 PepSY domain-containing protein [Virgibacillus natechei]
MRLRQVVLATGIGLIIGYLAKQQVTHYQKVTPEKALKQAKDTFKKNGPISGSWIYMKPEEVEKNGLLYNAYRGGVTRNVDGQNKQYEFYVDVDTGAVVGSVQTA